MIYLNNLVIFGTSRLVDLATLDVVNCTNGGHRFEVLNKSIHERAVNIGITWVSQKSQFQQTKFPSSQENACMKT